MRIAHRGHYSSLLKKKWYKNVNYQLTPDTFILITDSDGCTSYNSTTYSVGIASGFSHEIFKSYLLSSSGVSIMFKMTGGRGAIIEKLFKYFALLYWN